MTFIHIVIALLLFSIASPSQSQVYKCIVGGHVIYQQQPCDNDTGRKLAIDSGSGHHNASEKTYNKDVFPHYTKAQYINIEPYCDLRYPKDNKMRQYCVDNEKEKKRELDKFKGDVPLESLNYCYHDKDSWSSRNYCAENQKEAYDIVSKLRLSVPKGIIDRCIIENTTWSSRRYCVEREDKARRQRQDQ